MRLILNIAGLAILIASVPRTGYAYIDPGLASSVLQGLLVIVFGGATAFVLRPWRWFKSVFRRAKEPGSKESNPANGTTDDPDESNISSAN